MTTRVIVMANHGETGATFVDVYRYSSDGSTEVLEKVVLTGPTRWHEFWVPDHGHIIAIKESPDAHHH
jgi:hypothetical protein